MNVLEKILEEIEEIEKLEGTHMGYWRNIFRDGFVHGIGECKKIIRSHMDKTVEKEKVTSAEIISRKIDGKTYYEIKFKKVGEDEYTIGYSSFKLNYVVQWLNECFEFCGEAKVSCENDGWIPVEERLPDKGIYVMCCFDDGTVDVLWQNWQEDKSLLLYADIDNQIRKVIAWQRLPKPYKPKKDITASGEEHIMSRFMKVEVKQ